MYENKYTCTCICTKNVLGDCSEKCNTRLLAINSCVQRWLSNLCVQTATKIGSCFGALNYARTALYFYKLFLEIIYETWAISFL